jgi:hypothetical protein
MHASASAIESTEPRAELVRPHHLLILPELRPGHTEGITILILADGNQRSSPGGGYAGGAQRVVSVAEHLARRPDVTAMVACILSPDNIAKRGDSFFSALYEEFIQLGRDIETRGALVGACVRMEVSGDLGSLRARGSRAIELAAAIEAVVAMTAGVANPDLRLILGVGYGRDTARELDVDIILRTGMEEPGVIRLSGLGTSGRIANCAITTLWPHVEAREVDDVIDLCKRHVVPGFAGGHSVSAIVDLALALSKVELGAPVRATIITSAPLAALAGAVERLFAGPLRASAITVEITGDELAVPKRYGRGMATLHELRIVRGSPRVEGKLLSVLAPGQQAPLFMLPDWLPDGHANVYACGTSAEDMVSGILAAQRFSVAHPPLLGRDRLARRASAPRAPAVVEKRAAASDRDELGDRFAAKSLAWATSVGFQLPGAAWRTAATNYALTAFFIHFRIPTEWDEAGAAWEERADLTARYMLLVAAGDEGIFDRVFPGEAPEQRWARLEASSRFLQGVLESERVPAPPRVPGAELLTAIADQWRELFDRYCRSFHPATAASFRAGLRSLYAASLEEHRARVVRRERAGSTAMAGAMEARRPAPPQCVAARVRTLAWDTSLRALPAAASELRALVYLAEVSSAIGAGLLFQTAALAAPASVVTSESIAIVDAAATLLDYHVRLSNDLSGFLREPSGDRDPKENACTILVPGSVSGAPRAAAVVQALAVCKRIAAWLSGEVSGHIDRVAAAWPSMGTIFRRGAFVGRRVYEVGHYATVSRSEMSAIFDEAEAALR